MTDLIRLSLEQSLEVQDALRRNNVSLAELKKLTSGDNFRKAIDLVRYRSVALPRMVGKSKKKVHEYLKKTYGYDKLLNFEGSPNTLPERFKDGNEYHSSCSLCFNGSYGWVRDSWVQSSAWLAPLWRQCDRAVLED